MSEAETQVNLHTTFYDQTHRRDMELTPGFLFPSQVATLMQCEVEDLMEFAGAAFLPIFGATTAIRYPSQPMYVIEQRNRNGLVTFAKLLQAPESVEVSLANPSSLRPPMAFTALKSEGDDFGNKNRTQRI